jgi:DNA-binding winged helix-turn-helix (wHTH) protein
MGDLGEAPGGDNWIETVPRRGYRFIGPVVREDAEEALEGPPPLDAAPSVLSMPHDDAERRQVTAMSSELIGGGGSGTGQRVCAYIDT